MNVAETGLSLWLDRLVRRTALSEEDCRHILSLPAKLGTIRANHDFVGLGERVRAVCLIVKGVAARFGQTRSGRRQLSAFSLAGDAADLHSAVLPSAGSALSAITDVTLYRIPHPAIHEMIRQSASLARALWRDCTVDASIASGWILNNSRRDAQSRLAHLLCELAPLSEAIGGTRDRVTYNISQAHLGGATGLTSVHVNRMLRDLRESGLLIFEGRDIVIPNWQKLARVADFDPAYLHLNREHPDTGGQAPPRSGTTCTSP